MKFFCVFMPIIFDLIKIPYSFSIHQDYTRKTSKSYKKWLIVYLINNKTAHSLRRKAKNHFSKSIEAVDVLTFL